MKAKHFFLIVAAILVVVSVQGVGQAEIYSLKFNVFTNNQIYNGAAQQRIEFQVYLDDTAGQPPDVLKSPGGLVVTAPDGSTFDMSENCWVEWGGYFFTWKFNTDFINQNQIIPSGTYKLRAEDKNGKVLSTSDAVTVAFLDIPNVSVPANNATLTTLTPKLVWTKITGASHYRIYLFNESWKEPVYSNMYHVLHTNNNYFNVPKGVLLPGGIKYSLRIEARDNDKNLSRRSRGGWVTFYTP